MTAADYDKIAIDARDAEYQTLGDDSGLDESATGGGTSAPQGEASVLVTAVNITLNVIGGGLLAIPVSFDQTSLVPGIALLMLIASMSIYSMMLLTTSAQRSQVFSYKEMLTKAYGINWARAFDAVLIFYTFGILVGFGRIVADSMPKVADQVFGPKGGFFNGQDFWLIVASLIFFGLSSMPNLSLLKYSSAVGFLTIVYLGVMVIIRFAQGNFESDHVDHKFLAQDVRYWHFDFGFLQAIPILSTSFSCHYNIPGFYSELKDRSPRRMGKAIALFAGFSVPFYLMVGVLCVLMFGHGALSSKTAAGDVMNNFRFHDTAFNIARFGFFIQFLCSYPLVCIGCRRALNLVIFRRSDIAHKFQVLEALVLVLVSGVAARFVPSIDDVFAINGAIFGLAIVVTVPSLIYLRIMRLPPAPGSAPPGAYDIQAPLVADSAEIPKSETPSEAHSMSIQHLHGAEPESTPAVSGEPLTQSDASLASRCVCYFSVTFGLLASVMSLIATVVHIVKG